MKQDRSKDAPITAAELLAQLESDPSYRANRERLAQQRQEVIDRSKREATGVLADLASAGFAVNSVADLFNRRMNYEAAVPILLAWLPRVSDVALKQDLVRALTVPCARPSAAFALVKEFRAASSDALKWAIGNALSVVADDSVLGDIIQLLNDAKNGKAREMLALALGNMKSDDAANTLIGLLGDSEVAGHAIMAIGDLRLKRARDLIAPFEAHPKSWVRSEARKALAKIGGEEKVAGTDKT